MKAEEVFTAALEKSDPTLRAIYLDECLAGNGRLREEVEGLLRSNENAGSFLEQSVFCPATTVDEPVTEKAGSQIGPYKLLQQIGEGGMGVVFMAKQEKPVRRKVALKIIRPGMDSSEIIARFEAERQALALMDHPNIARVLDAGATDSRRPYFVMELVRGVSINTFCDHNNLPTSERLACLSRFATLFSMPTRRALFIVTSNLPIFLSRCMTTTRCPR